MSIEDLLQAILGGATAQQPPTGPGHTQGDPLAEMLQGILGGVTSPQPSGTPGARGGIEDILGGILGQGPTQGSSLLAPIVEKLAKQLNLPPAIAQMIVTFALSKILPSLIASVTTKPATRPERLTPGTQPFQPSTQPQEGLNLDDLLGYIQTTGVVDSNYLNSTGMTQELALQAGVDNQTATLGLQEVFKLLGGALANLQQGQKTSRGARAKTTKAAKATKTSKTTKTGSSRSTSRKRTSSKKGSAKGSDLDSILEGFDI